MNERSCAGAAAIQSNVLEQSQRNARQKRVPMCVSADRRGIRSPGPYDAEERNNEWVQLRHHLFSRLN